MALWPLSGTAPIHEVGLLVPHIKLLKPISAPKLVPLEQMQEIPVEAPEPVIQAPVASPAPVASSDIQQIIIDAANRHGADAGQLLRIAACESGFNLSAYNPSGATGLFQFMPATFYGNGGTDLSSAYDQADVAAKMFANGHAYEWECK